MYKYFCSFFWNFLFVNFFTNLTAFHRLMVGWMANNELEGISKEAAAVQGKYYRVRQVGR
jgi:hypothetical protein